MSGCVRGERRERDDSSASSDRKPGRRRCALWVAARTAVLLYVLICAGLFFFQRQLIYFPNRVRFALAPGFEPWELQGKLIGYKRVTGASDCLFFLHGNAGNGRGWSSVTAEFPGDIYLLEYPGYGERSGHPSEETLRAAALEAFDALPERGRRIVCGQSLGAGATTPLLRERADRIDRVVLITPFTSLEEVGVRRFPGIPVRWLLKDKMRLWDAWMRFKGEGTVVLAEHDEVIPRAAQERFSQFTDQRRRCITLPGTTHNQMRLSAADWKQVCQIE